MKCSSLLRASLIISLISPPPLLNISKELSVGSLLPGALAQITYTGPAGNLTSSTIEGLRAQLTERCIPGNSTVYLAPGMVHEGRLRLCQDATDVTIEADPNLSGAKPIISGASVVPSGVWVDPDEDDIWAANVLALLDVQDFVSVQYPDHS